MDELEKLAGMAAEADAAAAGAVPGAALGAPGPEAPPPEATRLDQANDLVTMFSGLVIGYVPETALVFTPEANARCAMALAPVMEKYNWSMDAMPCELVAAVVVGPVIYSAGKMVMAKIQAERAQVAAPAGGPAAPGMPFGAPVSDNVAPASGQHPQMALYKHG